MSAQLNTPESDPSMDTPFLNPMGAIKRPPSFSFPAADPGYKTPSPVNPNASNAPGSTVSFLYDADSSTESSDLLIKSFEGAAKLISSNSLKRVSWVDCSLAPPNSTTACWPAAQHSYEGPRSFGEDRFGEDRTALLSVNSAPAGQFAGDLRDQGRMSSAGCVQPCLTSSGISEVLGNRFGLEDVGTPLKVGGQHPDAC